MEIGFTHPEYLMFLVGVPILIIVHLISIKYLKRRAVIFANFKAVSRVLGSGQNLSVNTLPLVLRTLVLVALAMAVSGVFLQEEVLRTDVDFVIVLDASPSMMATDYSPNRLTVAKNAIEDFTKSLGNLETKVGVIYFAGIAQTGIPITSDMLAVRKYVESIDVSNTGGTAIGDAIMLASNQLAETDRAKSIVLITDGQNNVGSSPLTAINFANEKGIVINTIGVATSQGSVISDSSLLSRLDEGTLKALSSSTGGSYFKVTSPGDISAAFAQLATSSKSRMSIELAPYLLLFGLSALIIEWLFVNTKYRTLP